MAGAVCLLLCVLFPALRLQAKGVSGVRAEVPDPVVVTCMEMEEVKDDDGICYLNTAYVIPENLEALLREAIAAFEQGNRDVSFVMIDIGSGEGICYKPNRPCYSASAVKAPFVFSLLAAGTGPDQTMFSACHYSDNAAYSRLRRTYGTQGFAAFMDAAGVLPEKARYNYPWDITSLDFAKLWYHAYKTLFAEPDLSEWLKETLTGTNNSSMSETLGEAYAVASKAGWITYPSRNASVYNDAGIVDIEGCPYLLAVTARTPDGVGRQNADALIPVLNLIHNQMIIRLTGEEE
ncbi:MAG: serine hydrolase [Lachnospiraceae bacterium]|nr:serine hydrolase [Lachnospiraceae bacterium]